MAPEPEGLDWRQDEYDGIPPRYMAVTADKYELPVAVFDNIQDLSRWAHTSTATAHDGLGGREADCNHLPPGAGDSSAVTV